MMKILKTCILILLFGGISGCFVNDYERILSLAEQCLEGSPDSASQWLEQIGDVHELSDNQRAKFFLIRTQANHKMHKSLVNDSLIDFSVRYFCKENKRHDAAKALIYKGLVHRQRSEFENAAEAFALSEQWFEGIEDDRYKALLYNHFGLLMSAQANYEDALVFQKKAYMYYSRGDSAHYMMSACGNIANLFKYLGKLDSTRIYFEKGLQYKGQVPVRRYFLYLQNYANFLRKTGEYDRAERMLQECELYITDGQKYSVYSSLATLYYETGDYPQALIYAERMLDSRDSQMMRGCYFHLYRIYTKLGDENVAHGYYKQYTDIHDAIQARMKTKEVAVIPRQVEIQLLSARNKEERTLRMWLVIAIVLLAAGAFLVYLIQHVRHKREQTAKDREMRLAGELYQKQHQKMQDELSDKSLKIGNLKSIIRNKDNKIERIEKEKEEDSQKQRDTIKKQKEKIGQLEVDYEEQLHTTKAQKKDLDNLAKSKKMIQSGMKDLAKEVQKEELFKEYLQNYRDEEISNVLLYLRYGIDVARPVSESDCGNILKDLLHSVDAGICETIEQEVKSHSKRIICYLLALGLDDKAMLERAVPFVALETLRKYHKECRDLVDGLLLSDRSLEEE